MNECRHYHATQFDTSGEVLKDRYMRCLDCKQLYREPWVDSETPGLGGGEVGAKLHDVYMRFIQPYHEGNRRSCDHITGVIHFDHDGVMYEVRALATPTPVDDERVREIRQWLQQLVEANADLNALDFSRALSHIDYLLDRLGQAERERDAVVLHSHNKSAELEQRIAELTTQLESVRAICKDTRADLEYCGGKSGKINVAGLLDELTAQLGTTPQLTPVDQPARFWEQPITAEDEERVRNVLREAVDNHVKSQKENEQMTHESTEAERRAKRAQAISMIWAREAGVSVYLYEGEHEQRIIEIRGVLDRRETVLATATIERSHRDEFAKIMRLSPAQVGEKAQRAVAERVCDYIREYFDPMIVDPDPVVQKVMAIIQAEFAPVQEKK